jgi:predicted Zn-dependent protease
VIRILVIVVATAWATAQTVSYTEAIRRMENGEFSHAIELIDAILKQRPADLRALTLKGMALSGANYRQAGNRQFEQALSIDPNFAPALRGLAMNEAAQGKVVDAQRHFESVLKLTPQDPIPRLGLGEIYLAGKQPAKAVAVLAQMPMAAGAAAHFQAGLLLAQSGNYATAAREFELARGGPVSDYDVSFNLALALFRSDEYAKAIQTAKNLIVQGNQKAEVYNLLGRAYEKAGDVRNAYDSLRTATKVDPADEVSYIDLIAICIDHRNLELAEEIAEIGVSKIPGSGPLRLQKGVVLATAGRFPEARTAFEGAIQVSPESNLPHVALGLMLLQMDQTNDAVDLLRRRTKQQKEDYLVLWFLGEALNRGGADGSSAEAKEATSVLKRSAQLRPDVAAVKVTLAKLLLRTGDLDGATRSLEAALKLEPDNVAAMYRLAQVLSKKDDPRAKELFAKVSKAKADEREQFTTRGLQQIVREGSR